MAKSHLMMKEFLPKEISKNPLDDMGLKPDTPIKDGIFVDKRCYIFFRKFNERIRFIRCYV